MAKRPKFYKLDHRKHGIGGLTTTNPAPRKQDRRAISAEMYAVVFFPKIRGIGKAAVQSLGLERTLANSPAVAKALFMDGIAKGEKWSTCAKAGHRVRRIKIIDLGYADQKTTI